ncbi:hypothetical protein LX36DRAFT_671696 [Colletotrichum falcatum]|nr:hypothetical protein LX36DRAFT_671696 [Colletotrichum falcatum]
MPAIQVYYYQSADNVDIEPSQHDIHDLIVSTVDHLSLYPSVRSAGQALIVDVRSDSTVWLLECAICWGISGYRGEPSSEDDLWIGLDTINKLQSYEWFNQKCFNCIYIFNSARLMRDRELLFQQAYGCLETGGFWHLQDFDRRLRCDGINTRDDTEDEVARRAAQQMAQNFFEEVNADHPVNDPYECCKTMNSMKVLYEMKLEAPTNEWRTDRQAEHLIRIVDGYIIRDLEDLYRDCKESQRPD